MTTDETTERATSLRAQARIGRAAASERGPGWGEFALIMEIAVQMEAEADELDAQGEA